MDNLIEYAGKQKKRTRKTKTKSNGPRSSARIKNRSDTGTKDPNAPPDSNDMDLSLEEGNHDNPMTPKRGTKNSNESPAKKVCKTDSNTDKSLGKGQDEEEITDPPKLDQNLAVAISPGGSGDELFSSNTEDEEETPAKGTEVSEIYV